MRFKEIAVLAGILLSASACGVPEVPSARGAMAGPSDAGLTLIGARGPGQLAPNAQFEFRQLSDALEAKIFEGELSQTQLEAVRSGELTQVLLERHVPTSSVHRRLLPQQPLLPHATYTLVSGAISSVFRIGEPGSQRLLRRWPKNPEGTLVLCADGNPAAFRPSGEIELYPKGSRALWSDLGAGCASLTLHGAQRFDRAALPPKFREWEIEPIVLQPFENGVRSAVAKLDCPAESHRLGLGCGQLFDNSLLVFPPVTPTLWVFEGEVQHTHWTEDDRPFAIVGLEPLSSYQIALTVFDSAGQTNMSEPTLFTPAAAARPVLAAVLADPFGPEAEGEWVQLHNEGSKAAQLSGWKLADRGTPVELSDYELAAGQSVLLVSTVFSPSASIANPNRFDVMKLPRLTVGGLLNAGEPLRLLDPSDVVISSFPALASEGAGISWTRTFASAPDDRDDSFVLGDEWPEIGVLTGE